MSKGLEYLIEAAAIVKEKVKDSKLLLILSTESKKDYNYLVKMIDKMNLSDHIILLGPKPHHEIPRYVAASDIVVVPSITEGFGFTAAEASAMGKAVVATYAGSLPEIIKDNESGILVKPRCTEEIADAICLLLRNQKLRKKWE